MSEVGKTLQPGDTIRVRINRKFEDRILEDGPYFTDKVWITVADQHGEITSAKWDDRNLCWVECD